LEKNKKEKKGKKGVRATGVFSRVEGSSSWGDGEGGFLSKTVCCGSGAAADISPVKNKE